MLTEGHTDGRTDAIRAHSKIPTPVRIGGESVVNGSDDFIHALNVALAGVELGVKKEDPLHDFPMGFLTVGEVTVVQRTTVRTEKKNELIVSEDRKYRFSEMYDRIATSN